MKWNNKIIRLYKDKKIIFNNLKTYERVINKKDKYLDSLSNEELKKLYKLYDERVTYLLDRCDCNIDLLSKKEIKIIAYKVVIYNKIKNKECFINR